MSVIAVYRNELKHPLESIPRLLNRANQALQTLERYKNRLDGVSGGLSALEIEDLVTVRDVATVLQRAEMVRRIAEEIESYIVELGSDGRLVLLQLEELMGGVEDDRRLVLRDYFAGDGTRNLDEAVALLGNMPDDDLIDLTAVAGLLRLPEGSTALDAGIQPRGSRLLSRIPRLSPAVVDRIVERFGNLQKVMRATVDDLEFVTGVGDLRARAVKEGLARLAESSILERYN
jgi:diadenylate cyclase